ncbi:MAG: hypothetical protein KDA88_06415 [Planctomycetaceae bacterium]|nr:hypothetical protein [Planctomycetaceae bacterium]MCB9950066.1 hypothetical protein [Planctomycetaceae bacterium]
MQQITLKVSLDEANIILEGLGNLPFAKVYSLIGSIQEQAGQQIKGNSTAEAESGNTINPPPNSDLDDE